MRDAFRRRALPYLLSLPALLVCIGILIPFGTAIYYSPQFILRRCGRLSR